MKPPTDADLTSPAAQREWLCWLIEDSMLLSAREKQQFLQRLARGAYSAAEQSRLQQVLLDELQVRDRIRKES